MSPNQLLRNPSRFALAVATSYLLMVFPILIHYGFDTSAFIVAGDQFVDTTQLISPIIVKAHSAGYDGQFYYRIALSPLHSQSDAYGVHFDNPAWRVQRIIYPVLAWIGAFGQAQFVPTSLFLVNLLGIGVIAFFAARVTVRLSLPTLTSLAVVLWPGFIISLTHDTTEIVAAAFILAALEAYFSDRLIVFAILGALAALTRETGVLFVAGIFCLEGFEAIHYTTNNRRWRRLIVVGAALLPFVLWREVQFDLLGQSPASGLIKQNFDWPFLGFAQAAKGAFLGTGHYGNNMVARAYMLGTLALLAAFFTMVSVRVPAMLRASNYAALAAGWTPIAALMASLTAEFWIGPTAYFRFFTECFVVGIPILALQPPQKYVTIVMLAGAGIACAGALGMSFHTLL